MTFDEVLEKVRDLLQSKGRVAYRALKRRFELDDEYLEDLKAELIDAEHVACDEDGKVLVWTGAATVVNSQLSVASSSSLLAPQNSDSGLRTPDAKPRMLDPSRDAGERRQLTVMFCDLVGSTALSAQLDPEELRGVVRAYQETCTEVIRRYDGHIAQHLGDGLLVYFGYPAAHEDDAHRAIRVGLDLLTELQDLNKRLRHPVQVRIGIHTGLVVIGEIGSGTKREILALGETPNLAARLQALAEPDTVVISAATQRLTAGLFTHHSLGLREPKGLTTPMEVYQILGESGAQSLFDVAVRTGLLPLVGRSEELGVLLKRWEQVKAGEGQVVLLSGEAGIGKSRLAQELKEQVIREGCMRIEVRCSPYHQNSALYPVIEHVQRVLQFQRDDTPQTKLAKLEQTLACYRFPQADTVPLLASLLSLPPPEGYPPLTPAPQKQKQRTQETLAAWLVEETETTAVYSAWEDLHWADPSTLEFLHLFIDQVPTARLLALLTFRPEFTPPWGSRSYLSQITLGRLDRTQVAAMVARVTGGKVLPTEVQHQILAKTDGVPLFVEELTTMVLESGLLTTVDDHYELTGPLAPLAIPSTLQDSLMARLDRLAATREIAQLGATLGREFSYDLVHAVSHMDEGTLQSGLRKLVGAELIYQRGSPPQATYVFKHALIQDAAYQSLLKSKRQHYHQQIAQVLEEQFPETKEIHPELVAHHYTEGGLGEQALPYWQRAGERSVQRSANAEAISHLSKGLQVLKTLPEISERVSQELALQMALGPALIATKGNAVAEVGQTYTRARDLCQQMEECPHLFPVLFGLRSFHLVRGEVQTAHELGEQLLSLAQRAHDTDLLIEAHLAVGNTSLIRGDFIPARAQFEQAVTLYNPQQHRAHAFVYGLDPGVFCRGRLVWTLWFLGYPDQALEKLRATLALAQEISHPFSLAMTLLHDALLHLHRREGPATQERGEALRALCTEQGFPNFLGQATIYCGWALVEQGEVDEGISQIRQGLAACRATGARLFIPLYAAILAETCGKGGQTEEGLGLLAEALDLVNRTGEHLYEAEIQRLKGELTLQQSSVQKEAEECFRKAIEVARWQSTKSLELRAVTSLARLWHLQGKQKEAHQMLSEIYGWFTEGSDLEDLKEAKALLEELSNETQRR